MQTKPDYKTTLLTDGKIILRTYNGKDAENLHKAVLSSIPELLPWMPWAHEKYALIESKSWIKLQPRTWKKGEAYGFVICDAATGEQIGGCGLNGISRENRRANLGYWVRSDRTGQGVAPAATRLLAKWAFTVLDLWRLEIVVAVGNARSLRVAEKVGAKREGILRNRLDISGGPHDAVMHSLIPGDIK